MNRQKREEIFNGKQSIFLNLLELWNYKELFYYFSWRDVKLRYKQTVLGVFWVFIQPILFLIIYYVLFNRYFTSFSPKSSENFMIFLFPGLIYWNFFSTTLTNAANSLVINSNMIKKIYFPRIVLPLSCFSIGFIDMILIFPIFPVLYFIFPYQIDIINLFIYFPLSLILIVFSSIGLTLALSSLNLLYRDFRFILPFFIQILMFLSPVFYSYDMVSYPSLRIIEYINPIAPAIALARYALLGIPLKIDAFISGILVELFLAIGGYILFKINENKFADFA